MKLSKSELTQAQIALFVAIILQIAVWQLNHRVFSDFQYIVIVAQLVLSLILGFTTSVKSLRGRAVQHNTATMLIGLVTLANFASLAVVIYALLQGQIANGLTLLGSAIAIFFTNVIVYALWYWEIDSPGLTNRRWTTSDKDFQFVQQDMPEEFPSWRPRFVDYMYISVINSLNGATPSAHPLTGNAKMLMATQAVISVLTLALVVARSVGILG
ncbi:MAG: hypothetical protein WBO49_02045 [Candidatus Saccharimonas sp.]